jgi:hypothetical protein
MNRFFLLCMGILQLSCNDIGKDRPLQPPMLPLQDLLAAPETLSIGGKSLVLSTSLWLDLMPTVPPSNPPLIAIIYVRSADSTEPPNSVSPDVVWIVSGRQIWGGFLQDTFAPGQNVIAKVARNGPGWDGSVEVIVRIVDSGGTAHLLRAASQQIGKVY